MIDTTIRQIGHPTMGLTDTDPKKSAAFSPNLHKYLKEKGHFFKDGGFWTVFTRCSQAPRLQSSSELGRSCLDTRTMVSSLAPA